MHKATLVSAVVAGILLVPGLSAANYVFLATEPTGVLGIVEDEYGNVLYELGVEPGNPLLGFVRHYIHIVESEPATDHHNPNHSGGGGGGGGGGSTDCTSTAYKTTGWYWTSPYSGTASSYASVLDTSAETWDAETGTDVFGSITSGSSATAGVQDYVNQHDWTDLGDGGTIAVTTTWYYRGSGEAVESDAEYNTYYPWSTNGDSNSMDVQNIATHELGHTFGLGHPNGGGIECLTMYAYADYGETQKRTLGDGDILGIEAIYGA